MTIEPNIPCERCHGAGPVLLLLPATASRSEFGDWVCAKCSPLAAELIHMWQLDQLVNG